MATLRERLVAAAAAAYNADPPDGVPELQVTRVLPYRADQLPATALYRRTEGVQPIHGRGGGSRERRLELTLEHRAGDEADLEPLLSHATAVLDGAALADGDGPVSTDVVEVGTDWETAVTGDGVFVLARQRFSAAFQTGRGTQETR